MDIKEFRKREGLTQQRLSELVDVDVTTVSRWERDLAVPGPDAHAALRNLMTRPVVGSIPIELLKDLVATSSGRVDLVRGDGFLLAQSRTITDQLQRKFQMGHRPMDRPTSEFVADSQQEAIEMMFGGYASFYREVSMLSFTRVEYSRPHHTFPSDHRVTQYFNTEIGPCYLNTFTASNEVLAGPVIHSIL